MGVFNSDLVIKIVLRSNKGAGEYFAIAVEHLSKWLEVCDMRFSCTLYLLRGWWVVLADDTHRVACVYLALGIRLTLFRVRAAVVNIRELVFTSIAFPPLSVL